MVKYFVKRLLVSIPILFGIILVIFLLLNFIPGSNSNNFASYDGGDALDRFFEKFDIEDGLFSRYVRYCYNIIVKHDFNPVDNESAKVGQSLAFRLETTLTLTLLASLAAFFVGIPLGIYTALHRGKWQDHFVSSVFMVFSSIPSYCLTIFLVIFFSLWLQLLPATGLSSGAGYIMPTIVLSIGGISLLARMTRSAIVEVLDHQYITALQAKGLKRRDIIYKHILKNSLTPIISTINNLVAQMFCSTLVVENFFAVAGIGSYLVNAVSNRNQHVILGCVIVIAALLMLLSIVSDILCMLVNPKMRSKYGKTAKAVRRDNVEA